MIHRLLILQRKLLLYLVYTCYKPDFHPLEANYLNLDRTVRGITKAMEGFKASVDQMQKDVENCTEYAKKAAQGVLHNAQKDKDLAELDLP